MANSDTPYGFKPTGKMYGLEPFEVDASNATAFFRGDAVNAEADGNVGPAAAGATSIIGACVGSNAVSYTTKASLAASTAGTVMCAWHPDQIYLVQTQTGDTVAQTMLFSNQDHVAGAGSTVTGLSGHELNTGTQTTTNGGSWKVIGFLRSEDNDTTAANAKAKAILNTGEGLLKLITGLDT